MDIITKRAFFEYFRLEELQNTMIGERIYHLFSQGTAIDFNKFLQSIAVLAKGTPEERLQLFFKIYDIKGQQVID